MNCVPAEDEKKLRSSHTISDGVVDEAPELLSCPPRQTGSQGEPGVTCSGETGDKRDRMRATAAAARELEAIPGGGRVDEAAGPMKPGGDERWLRVKH